MTDQEDAGRYASDDIVHEDRGYVDDMPPISRPLSFLIRMGAFLVLVLVACGVIWQPLGRAFAGNLYINSLILAVFGLATAYCFLRVYLLTRDVVWLNDFRNGDPSLDGPGRGSLLNPLSAILRGRRVPLQFSSMSAKIVADSIASRFHESRENTRYAGNLLIFLGILGTFWGLTVSFGSIQDAVSGMSGDDVSPDTALTNLQDGLAGPLAALTTAVSSSLFGIAGALIIGFLGLQASQAQTRFFTEFEDWIHSATIMDTPDEIGAGSEALQDIADAMHENVRQVTALNQTMKKAETERQQLGEWVTKTATNLSGLDDVLRTQKDVLSGIASVVQDVAKVANERGKQSLEVLSGLQKTLSAPRPAESTTPTAAMVDMAPVEQRLGQLITVTQANGDRMSKTIAALHELSARVLTRSEQATGGGEAKTAAGAETVALLKSLNDKTSQLLVATTSGLAAAARFAPEMPVAQIQAPAAVAPPLDLSALNDLNIRVSELVRIAQGMEHSQSGGESEQLRGLDAIMNKILHAIENVGGSDNQKSIEAIVHYTKELAQLARGSSEREVVEALRSLNQITHSIRESAETGRTDMMQELRAEMKILTKTIAALILESRRGEPAPRGAGR